MDAKTRRELAKRYYAEVGAEDVPEAQAAKRQAEIERKRSTITRSGNTYEARSGRKR